MDELYLTLQPRYKRVDKLSMRLYNKNDIDYFEIPTSDICVYNDIVYNFCISGANDIPTRFYVNDDIYDVKITDINQSTTEFYLSSSNKTDASNSRPFVDCYGTIRLETEINGVTYSTKSIRVCVSNTEISTCVINMIEYIDKNCEKFLYEERKHSAVAQGVKNSEPISIESKMARLKEIEKHYSEAYSFFKRAPYTKLKKSTQVVPLEKAQSISSATVKYVAYHCDELILADGTLGIRYNKKYYQPKRVLAEHNTDSLDVYENQIVLGFLKTIVTEIINMIKKLKVLHIQPFIKANIDGYEDSAYFVYKNCLKRIENSIDKLTKLKADFIRMYYKYKEIFGIEGIMTFSIPRLTSVFRTKQSYRIIYIDIQNWFNHSSYDLSREELLMSFLSISKIYEYYCLTKLLYYFDQKSSLEYIGSHKEKYLKTNQYYNPTKFNNTFVFAEGDMGLTVYFQPVIYNRTSNNKIDLFRNTSTSYNDNGSRGGMDYTPDYLIKIEHIDSTEYVILDAKFSSVDTIRKHQLQDLVYKYLFSISPLNDRDKIIGMYIFSGKTSKEDGSDNVYDYAMKLNKVVSPFCEILTMSGNDIDNYTIPRLICEKAIEGSK